MQTSSNSAIALQLTPDTQPIQDSFTSTRSYQFTLRQQGSVNFRLAELSGDATLNLRNRTNQTLLSSNNTGLETESIRTTLEAGTYYLEITATTTNPVQFRLDAKASFTGLSRLILHNASTGALISQGMNGTTLEAEQTRDSLRDSNWIVIDRGNYDASTPTEEWLWRNQRTGEIAFWKRNGTQIEGVALPTIDPSWKLVRTGDLDLDGDRDLIWRNERTGENAVWQMNGTTLEKGIMLTSAEKSWNLADVYDIDGDGDLDLLWNHSNTGETAWWQMNGVTLEKGFMLATVGSEWKIEGTADFDSDGERDLVWRNARNGEIALWQMKNAAIAKGAILTAVPDTNWKIKGFNDFSGDRKTDILWQNAQTGQVAYWEIQDFALIKGDVISTNTLGSKDWQILTPLDRFVDPSAPILPTLQTGTIQGIQWNDTNGNGTKDTGETGLSGWTVFLDLNQNGALDSGEQSTVTDSLGNYRFTGLSAGNYSVAIVPTSGWTSTSPQSLPKNTLISTAKASDLVFDATRNRLYMPSSSGNLERFDIGTQQLLTPILVGNGLLGADITPDGKTLYIADTKMFGVLHKVDLTNDSTKQISFGLTFGEGGTVDVSIGSNGKGLVSTKYNGSGSTSLREIDINTDTFTIRKDIGTIYAARIARSVDRSLLFVGENGVSTIDLLTYSSATDKFSPVTSKDGYQFTPAVNRDGSMLAVQSYGYVTVYDSQFKQLQNLVGADGEATFSPTQDILYAVDTKTDQILAFNTKTWQVASRISIGENVEPYDYGTLKVSDDGRALFYTTRSGVRMFGLSNSIAQSIAVKTGQMASLDFGVKQLA